MLGRRDPEQYGSFTLTELEGKVYEWARELELTVHCRQTNDEGEFVDWCHDAHQTVDGIVINPGAWTHYARRSTTRSSCSTIPIVEVHLSNVDEREEWRRVSVIEDVVSHAIRRAGPDGYREALEYLEGARVNTRIARLRELARGAAPRHERQERRLPRRLRELERRAARRPRARAALHRLPLHPGGARRRGRRGRADEARRDRASWPSSLNGTVGFEAATLTFAQVETLRAGGLELVPRTGLVEALRAVKDDGELDSLRRACKIADRAYERLAAEVQFGGRTELDVSWDVTRLFHEEGGEGLAFESIVGSGPTGRAPHAHPGDRVIGTGELVVVDAGCTVDGYCSDCTRTFATGPLDGEAQRRTPSCSRRSARRSRRSAPASAASTSTRAARQVVEASPFGGMFGHGLGHGVGLDVHEEPRLSTETTRHPRARQRRHRRARRLCRGQVRRPDRGPRHRHRGRDREAHELPQGPDRGRAARFPRRWPRRSTPTSSRTACTSSSTARCGASSSSSTSSRARAARSSGRS